MPSHTYQFSTSTALRLIVLPVVPVIAFAIMLHVAAAIGLLPPPQPRRNIDQTVLTHQARASVVERSAGIVLIGDSSCLMDVSAVQLERSLGGEHRVLNLGCLSYLDLPVMGRLVSQYAARNAGLPRTVVLLCHPEFLRGIEPVPQFAEQIEAFYQGKDFCTTDRAFDGLSCGMGLEILRGRVVDPLLPAPLKGAYGRYYGFTADLDRYLSREQGSAIDPNQITAENYQASAEYRLAKRLEASSQQLRTLIPTNVQLVVGVTPVPSSFALPDHADRHQEMLREWGRWLRTDTILTNLPATLPDELFASLTHLNERGQTRFTEALQRDLKPRIASGPMVDANR